MGALLLSNGLILGAFCTQLDKEAVLHKLRTIQDYLCSFEDQGVAVVDVSTTSFAQTLDQLHSYLLKVSYQRNMCLVLMQRNAYGTERNGTERGHEEIEEMRSEQTCLG